MSSSSSSNSNNSNNSRPVDLAPRASGKRRRIVYNPHKWASSILSQRTKVLALGVSYPNVRHQIRAEISSKVNLLHVEESVEQAVELVRRNALTQMDGRDLARILALESSNDTHCYTVSLEQGATYAGRHTTANFNRPTFCAELKNRYGSDIKFRQVILDYYWIPSGTWQRSHWRSSFFNTTLPNFVKEDLLDFNPGLFDESDVTSFSTSGRGGGVIYLPFCLHCIQQIIAALDVLSKYYTIEFVYKDQLSNNALWAATSTIDSNVMQNWLGKAINQEDVYCTITPSEVYGSSIDENVTRDEILNVLRRIENFYDVRMIKLRALQMYNPRVVKSQDKGNKGKRGAGGLGGGKNVSKAVKSKRTNNRRRGKKVGISIGGFIGLKDNGSSVVNGFDQKDHRNKSNRENSSGDNDVTCHDEDVVNDNIGKNKDENSKADQRQHVKHDKIQNTKTNVVAKDNTITPHDHEIDQLIVKTDADADNSEKIEVDDRTKDIQRDHVELTKVETSFEGISQDGDTAIYDKSLIDNSVDDAKDERGNNRKESCGSNDGANSVQKEGNENGCKNDADPNVNTVREKATEDAVCCESGNNKGDCSDGSALFHRKQSGVFSNEEVKNSCTEPSGIFEKQNERHLKNEVGADLNGSVKLQDDKTGDDHDYDHTNIISEKCVQIDSGNNLIKNDGIVEKGCKDTIEEVVMSELDQEVQKIVAINA